MTHREWIFGWHAVTAILTHQSGRVQGIWVDDKRRDARIRSLVEDARQRGIPVYREVRPELDRISGTMRHQGVAAKVVESGFTVHSEKDLPNLLAALQDPPLLLVLDGVQDPHNLGACLRSAEAAGVHAVIAPADRAVGLTATVRKVACGAAETVPFVRVTNLVRALRMLKEQGLWVIGAAGEAETTLYEVDFTGPVAIVLGAEEKGLRRLTREVCDSIARIPMAGHGESLNVSVAAGILLFEAVRQRRNRP